MANINDFLNPLNNPNTIATVSIKTNNNVGIKMIRNVYMSPIMSHPFKFE